MKMTHYVLSPHYRVVQAGHLTQVPWIVKARAEGKIPSGQGVLCHQSNDQFYLVNPVIQSFLEAFSHPTTLRKVAGHFAKKAGCKVSELKETMIGFMDEMYDMEIIVTEKKAQKLRVKQEKFRKDLLLPGVVLEGYKIIELLAEKSDLEIYKAIHPGTGEVVAIKHMCLPEGLKKKKYKRKKRKFFQEFKLMAELADHPGVCQVKEKLCVGNHLLGVLEFIEGCSLRKFNKSHRPDISQKLKLLNQVLSVMAHLHKNGIVHGDLHSSNFMVSGDLKLKLIDFNLSNHVRLHEWEIMREGGVQEYMPPEKIDNHVFHWIVEQADFRSEVFQIGVIIYLLVYERMPFTGFTFKELVEAICNQPAELAHQTPAGEPVPDRIIQLLEKSLQKTPDLRFESASEMNGFWLGETLLKNKKQ